MDHHIYFFEKDPSHPCNSQQSHANTDFPAHGIPKTSVRIRVIRANCPRRYEKRADNGHIKGHPLSPAAELSGKHPSDPCNAAESRISTDSLAHGNAFKNRATVQIPLDGKRVPMIHIKGTPISISPFFRKDPSHLCNSFESRISIDSLVHSKTYLPRAARSPLGHIGGISVVIQLKSRSPLHCSTGVVLELRSSSLERR
jgi:hypothetical protein